MILSCIAEGFIQKLQNIDRVHLSYGTRQLVWVTIIRLTLQISKMYRLHRYFQQLCQVGFQSHLYLSVPLIDELPALYHICPNRKQRNAHSLCKTTKFLKIPKNGKKDKQCLRNFRATARFILSPTLKNKYNSHDWLKISEPRKVTAKVFNEIPVFV